MLRQHRFLYVTSIYNWCIYARFPWTRAGLTHIREKAHPCQLSACVRVPMCPHPPVLWDPVSLHLPHSPHTKREQPRKPQGRTQPARDALWGRGGGAQPPAVLGVKNMGLHPPALNMLLPKRHHWAGRLILAKISYSRGGKFWPWENRSAPEGKRGEQGT